MAKGKKTGGRQKGVPNKGTGELKDYFESIDFCIPEKIVALLADVDSPKQIDTLLRLMEFIYPKRKAVDVKTNDISKLSYTEAIMLMSDIPEE